MAISEELTSNEMLRDALVRRQIYLSRYSKSLSSDIIAQLDKTEADLMAEIERRLARMPESFSNATHARLNTLAKSVADIRANAFDNANSMWSDQLSQLGPAEASYVDNAILHAAPVELETILPDAKMLGAIVSTEPMQGHLLQDWADRLQKSDVDRIMGAVRSGMVQGNPTDDIIQAILGSGAVNGSDGILELTRANIASLTQTAVATVAGEARAAYSDANSDIISKELFVATLDSRTTPECAALDGQQFAIGEGPQPPLHFNCRSVRVATIDGNAIGDRPATTATEEALAGLSGDERAAKVAELTGTVPAATTYQEWLSAQDASFQDEVLGPARGALFRDGMPLTGFVDKNLNPLTLDQLNSQGVGRLFTSPNVDDLTFEEARTALSGQRQADILAMNKRIDDLVGLDSTPSAAIGAWSDGAENSIISLIQNGDPEDMRAAAAMKGLIAEQKAVLLFQEGEGANDFLGSFTVNGKLEEVHQSLLDNGLSFHTLEPQEDGSIKAYVFGNDQATLKMLNNLGDIYGTKIEVAQGSGEFLGSTLTKEGDAAIRADAAAKYEDTIRLWLNGQPDSVREQWAQLRSDWDRAEARSVGIKGSGPEETKAVTDTWIKDSPIRNVAGLYDQANELDAGLKEVGAEVAAKVPGVKWYGASIKKEPRVLEKMAAGTPVAGITDIVRGSLIVDTPDAANAAIKELAKHYPIVDEGWRITPVGYFDRPVKILFPNGQIGEVLVAPPQLIDAKSEKIGGGHTMYVKYRSLADKGSQEAIRLAREQIDLYSAAIDSLPKGWQDTLDNMTGIQEMLKNRNDIAAALEKLGDPALRGSNLSRAAQAKKDALLAALQKAMDTKDAADRAQRLSQGGQGTI